MSKGKTNGCKRKDWFGSKSWGTWNRISKSHWFKSQGVRKRELRNVERRADGYWRKNGWIWKEEIGGLDRKTDGNGRKGWRTFEGRCEDITDITDMRILLIWGCKGITDVMDARTLRMWGYWRKDLSICNEELKDMEGRTEGPSQKGERAFWGKN